MAEGEPRPGVGGVCPRCGSALEPGTPASSCRTCLLRLGLETRLSAGTRLGPYEILEPIASGGMGEVYRALDERLKREVAVKVLAPAVSDDPDRLRRFEQEAQAASALNHPNIVAVYDVGSQDGTPFIVSELLEGQTLRGLLASGALPAARSLDLAAQIARGLAAAHAKGIVHRDLKPENVFVTRDDHVKILDFGIAKLTEVERPSAPVRKGRSSGGTQAGAVLGTLAYMAPEQLEGKPVDARSDVFSFGSVLYEMLAGRSAFARETPAETMSAIRNEEPPPLRSDTSGELDRIVRGCLGKDPDRRFPSARELVSALTRLSAAPVAAPSGRVRRIILALVVVALAAGGFRWWQARRVAEPSRIAVLPFENLGAPEDEYFADGIADEVRTKLTGLPGIEVIARGSSAPYRATKKTPREIARELGVRYLLMATVRWKKDEGANRVHVVPELVEVRESGAPTDRWQQPFDVALTDVFLVQSDIASRVARSLHVALRGGEEKRLSEKPTGDMAAYDAFLKGESLWNGASADAVSLRKMQAFYEQAVEWDPAFARAWARISQVSSRLYLYAVPTPELRERARAAAERAAAIAPDEPDAHLALGGYELYVAGDAGRALEQLSEGRRLAPGDPDLLREAALAERALGRWDVALAHFRQAVALDPRSASSLEHLAVALIYLRRYGEARETIDRGLRLAPAKLDLIEDKAATYLMEGDLAGARAVLEASKEVVEPASLVAFLAYAGDFVWVLDEAERQTLLRMSPGAFDDDRGVWALCLTEASTLAGDASSSRVYAEQARKAFEEQVRAAPDDAQRRMCLGLALAYLGRKEEAIREGERGLALDPVSKDAESGPYYQHQLVRIYILVGEPEKALDRLEPLLNIPSWLSPGLLRIDPGFDPLRRHPRFQRLVSAG